MTTVTIYGTRVRQARILRHLTSTAVSEHMGWRTPKQTRLEHRSSSGLANGDLDKLATLLRFAPEFFTREPLSHIKSHDLLFRTPKTVTATGKERLAVYLAVVGDVVSDLDPHLPPCHLDPLPAGTDVVIAARHARSALGIAEKEPIPHLTQIVEDAGIPIVQLLDSQLPHSHQASSARTGANRDRPVVLMHAMETWESTRAVLAHEIGHIAMHRYGDITRAQEGEARRFAAELLAPAASIAEHFTPAPTMAQLRVLKATWGIPLRILIPHLHESKLIDDKTASMLSRQLYSRINPATGHTWGRTEPDTNDCVRERPRRLAQAIADGYGTSATEELAARGLVFRTDLCSGASRDPGDDERLLA
ncbi:ImmA/IrrE family metallo-endopeptidase (plasmid) [Mycolicibacterium fortuitum]|uniref:ImmA/IrrE family metallo-endopeptidase n=1 Tax=Mycolicibacterium conceptionense TaxID=451644 RepID=UPI003204D61F|nr:ImmA/IrrE family metallo-endopeptidase [Mycolicibacterium fortuitum]